jgi:hydrogenase nickel incorporation protein HypA/HybF
MHELSVTQSVLDIALREAEKNEAKRIGKIRLVIGDLAGIVDDSVSFYFDLISRGSIAEGATLEFRRVAPRFRCRQCGTGFSPQDRDWRCPSCGAQGGEVVAGRDFYLESIEIE